MSLDLLWLPLCAHTRRWGTLSSGRASSAHSSEGPHRGTVSSGRRRHVLWRLQKSFQQTGSPSFISLGVSPYNSIYRKETAGYRQNKIKSWPTLSRGREDAEVEPQFQFPWAAVTVPAAPHPGGCRGLCCSRQKWQVLGYSVSSSLCLVGVCSAAWCLCSCFLFLGNKNIFSQIRLWF